MQDFKYDSEELNGNLPHFENKDISAELIEPVRTTAGSGSCSWVAPVTPDASLSGAIDANWVAPHLDKIDSPRLESCQPTRCLITNIIHHLRESVADLIFGLKQDVLELGGAGPADRQLVVE
ncbi:hypothetical protein INR49_002314, partial [Caranx melampygus]